MWYTNTFQEDAQSKWICPNITDIELLTTDKTLQVYIKSCSDALNDYDEYDLTPYSDDGCFPETVTETYVSSFTVYTMLLSETFNPYTYYKT